MCYQAAHWMGINLADLERRGLAACAVVFTFIAYCAAICSIIVYAGIRMNSHLSPGAALSAAGFFWLLCMVINWRSIASTRELWSSAPSSLFIFHAFQFISIGLFLAGSFAFNGGYQQIVFDSFGMFIEITVTLFYFSYILLGLTLQSPVERAAYWGLAFALGAACWTEAGLARAGVF